MTQTPAAAAVAAIDDEHQVHVALLDTLTESLAGAADPTEIEAILSHVSDYSRAHFMSEQLLMPFHCYPGYEGHNQEYGRLFESFAVASAVLGERPMDRTRAAASIAGIRIELTAHIACKDNEFLGWLVTAGIGAASSVRVTPTN